MTPPTGTHLFLLGLASGIALLTLTSYRRASPTWLKWLLVASGLVIIKRYVTTALFIDTVVGPDQWLSWSRSWCVVSLGLTMPSLFAIDQLLRHPAMTPKRLLGWCIPFLAYSAFITFAETTPAIVPRPPMGWWIFGAAVHGVFLIGFVGIVTRLIPQVPSGPIRIILLELAAGHLLLGLAGLFHAWPLLYAEMLMLLVIWHAYDTSAVLQ